MTLPIKSAGSMPPSYDEQIPSSHLKHRHPYHDVAKDHWYACAVNTLAILGVNIGKTQTNFSADDLVDKAQMATILYSLDGEQRSPRAVSFSDIPEDRSYADAASWAVSNQILSSTEGAFQPESLITREEMVTTLYRYAHYKKANTTFNSYLGNYSDGGIVSNRAKEAINWAISSGVFVGSEVGVLNLGVRVSRAEYVVTLYRYIKNVMGRSVCNLADNYGIFMEFPSTLQKTIQPGRDFYVIGDFVGNVVIPDNAYVEVKLIEKNSSQTVRTIYSNKKNDYDSLNVDYQYLNVWQPYDDREGFRKAGMPDLVYDKNDPKSFQNTWIKCFYTDQRFAANVFGGLYTRDTNTTDQFGKNLEVLSGDYIVQVNVKTADRKTTLAYAEEEITIGTYPAKSVSPFDPIVHFDKLNTWCGEEKYEVFLDPFPGYWNCEFINPEWGEDYYGTITAKWKFMDAIEYNSGNIHFFIYNVGTKSTSYNCEIGEIQSKDGNLDRLACHYYDIGEPSIGRNGSTFFQMESMVEFTRAEYLTAKTTLGDNHVDMSTFDSVDFHRLASSRSVVCSAEQVIALYGVCQPVMSVGPVIMDQQTSTFTLNNRIEKLVYTITPNGEAPITAEKDVLLVRENPPQHLEAEEGIFEFKHDFSIRKDWSGRTITITYDAIDSFGNTVVSGAKGPTFYVTATGA